ncbi:MAG: hypothetical protein WD396_04485 [Pseudohongiellaceae bacterium]
MTLPRLTHSLFLAGLLWPPLALAQQDDPTVLGDDVTLDTDFGFDDDALFAAPFEESAAGEGSGWLDDFTVSITQQLSGQVNSHNVNLAPGFTLPRAREIETNRLGINVRYQNPFAPGWLLQGSAQSRIYWPEDYEYRSNGDSIETESRVNELFVQRSFDTQSFSLGRQTVVWGETVGNSVLDVINHVEFRDFSIIDIEDARLNQWLLVWDFFGGDNASRVSTFLNLYPEFNPAPVRGSPLFFDPGYHLPDYSRGGKVLLEMGTQWRRSFAGSDVALMAAYLYENQLRYEPPAPGGDTARPDINDFLLLGFSANRAIGRLLLNFDLAFSHNVLADSFAFPGTNSLSSPVDLRKDQVGTSFGFEYGIDNEQSVSLGIQAQKLLDEREGLEPGQTLVNQGIFGSWLVRYSNNLMNGDLVLSSTLQGDLALDSLLALIGVDYTVNDNWAIGGQLIAIAASGATPLVLFDEDLRLSATLTYSF